MPIQFAPTELLYHIFQYLPKSSLLACATVCKTWQPTAVELFYEHAELSEKTKEIWLHIVHQTRETKNVGVFVKKLTVSLAFSTTLTQGQFLKVISYFPFVKVIDLDLSGYKLHYLAYLTKRNTGCVTYLEDINAGDLFTDYQMQQYFLCAYSFRNSLKYLTLRNPNSTYTIDGHARTAIFFLNQFTSLAQLSIISDSRVNELPKLLEVFQSCANLVNFVYQNNNLSSLDDEEQLVQNHLFDVSLVNTMKCRRPRLIIPTLKTIELRVPSLNKQLVRDIIPFFSNTLTSFKVNMTHINYRTWLQEHDEIFDLYLGKVKNLELSISNCNPRKNSIGSAAKSTCNSKHWSFIKSVIGGRNVLCQMHISFGNTAKTTSITMKRNERNLTLCYNIENFQEIGACLEEFSPIYHSTLVNRTDTVLNSIIVELPLHLTSKSLEIIKYFSSLQHPPPSILIRCSNSTFENGYWLELSSILIDNFVLDNSPNLKYALFKDIQLPMTQLYSIFDTLPHLEILKLLNCKLEGCEGVYTIDIRCITHLKQLVLDLGFVDQQTVEVQVHEEYEEKISLHIVYIGTIMDHPHVINIMAQRIDQVVFLAANETTTLSIPK